jgi:Ca2+-binding RTX toxin-like protein
VERLTLTGTANINGTGNELNNLLTGNSGNNVLAGGAGHDALNGGAGEDALDGGPGRDRLIGGAGDDTYLVDLVQAGEGVAATVRLEDTIIEGRNQGTDQVILRGIVSDLMRATTLTLGANLERLDASRTADTKVNLTGNALDNELIGNDADNLLIGLAGNDRLDGGAGDDVVIGGQGNDVLIGGAGNDTYVFGRGEGQDVIQDTEGVSDKMLFGRGIAPVDVILSRQADDLRLALRRTSDQVTIRDWYAGAANQVETIETGTRYLLHTQVESLLQAMAQFTSDTGLAWEAAAGGAGTAGQQAQFQTILAAHWQAS